jgi:hypothetical protein
VTARPGAGKVDASGKLRREFPAAFINAYSQRFLADYQAGTVDLPRDLRTDRVPVAL